MEFRHASVLLRETVDALAPERGGVFADCTAGGGGHSYEIARRLPEDGRLISIDRDPDAVAAATARLAVFGDKVTVIKSDYSDVGAVLDSVEARPLNGIMWDLGVSSFKLEEEERGFSYV